EKTYQKVQQKIMNGMSQSEILVFMTKHGIKYNHVKPLVDKYGSKEIAMQKLKGNPYLLTNVKGIGFKKADEIAYIMKYDMKSENRIKACVLYIIEEVNQNGNSWINQRQMFNRLIDYLGIEKERIQEVLNKEIKGITCVDGKYTKTVIYETEKYIADKIKYALTNVKNNWNFDIEKYKNIGDISLTSEQLKSLSNICNNNISLVDGSAGCVDKDTEFFNGYGWKKI